MGVAKQPTEQKRASVDATVADVFRSVCIDSASARAMKHRKHSVFKSEDIDDNLMSWLTCFVIGVTVGGIDGVMVRLARSAKSTPF
jgi:hypothetical protein